MKKPSFRGFLRTVHDFVVFFLLVAFVVTCCMMLFVTTLADTTGLEFTPENVAAAAKLTFGNVVLIALLITAVDSVRRRLMLDRPVRRITQATERIMRGDFSVRIEPLRGAGMESFNRIIDALNQMAAELAGTETLRTDFIANVSHELKTPLAVMSNNAALLRQPGISGEEKESCARAIEENAHRLSSLITNVLKLNKLENQQIFPQWEELDLAEQLRLCLLGFEDAWERKDLEIQAELEEDLRVRSDGELLSLVWNNLISNAVKFTAPGGTVTLRAWSEGDWAVVAVTDTGVGIPPEVGRHIFEKFYQGDPSHATQGNGLGLALVKRVVDILGAEIGVQSVPGQGSTFTVRLRRK